MTETRPIEGFEDTTKIDKRTKAYREVTRARPEDDDVAKSIREAEEYAASILGNIGDDATPTGRLDIDQAKIPLGWSYAWRTYSVIGKENAYYMNELQRTGWRSVPADRHPEFMPKDWDGPIIIDGLILMECPTILVDRQKAKDNREAKNALANADRKLSDQPANTMDRVGEVKGQRMGVTKDLMRPVSVE